MKLTNHNKNNSYTINTFVIHGTITMTRKEAEAVTAMLLNEYMKAVKRGDTYTRDSLKTFSMVRMGDASLICIGVRATELIAERYNLQGYKPINYGIKIIK
jgi:hypothetical protein